MSEVRLPLTRSGRYRGDFTFTTGRSRKPILFLQLYGDISDHRIEQY